jgi:hypothetical protein
LDEFKAFLGESETACEMRNGKALMGIASPSCKTSTLIIRDALKLQRTMFHIKLTK